MLSDHRHGWNQLQRVIDRHLRRLTNRRLAVAAINIVNTQHVGDKQAVKLAALEDFCQIGPVFQVLVLPRTITRVRPQAGRLVAHTVHVESVETNFTGHLFTPEAEAV